MKNLYTFNVKYGECTIQRSVETTTYSAALNLLYFPPYGDTQADQTELLALKHKGNYAGNYAIETPSAFDFPTA